MNPILLMLEAIALVVLGAVGHVVRAKITDPWSIVDNLVIAVIVGIACYSIFGEPTSATVVPYMAAGYAGGEIFDWLFKPWWEKE